MKISINQTTSPRNLTDTEAKQAIELSTPPLPTASFHRHLRRRDSCSESDDGSKTSLETRLGSPRKTTTAPRLWEAEGSREEQYSSALPRIRLHLRSWSTMTSTRRPKRRLWLKGQGTVEAKARTNPRSTVLIFSLHKPWMIDDDDERWRSSSFFLSFFLYCWGKLIETKK